jgi:hypothetical protein
MPFDCRCPSHLNETPTKALLKCTVGTLDKYALPWHRVLCGLQSSGKTATLAEIASAAGTNFPKVGARARFYGHYPCLSEFAADYLPHAEVLVALAERNLGQDVNSDNVEAMRAEVERLANEKTHRQRQLLLRGIDLDFPRKSLSDPEVVSAIIERYEPALTSINNSGISLAGRVHELVLLATLGSAGLILGRDFEKPQNPLKNGDIRVKSRTSGDYLATEVKSLKSRERFARGLGEIGGEKVGAGFFDEPREFRLTLTQKLIGMSTSAVYMPSKTIAALPHNVRSAVNAAQRPFYRPITQYAGDMLRFATTGQLP